eukprot:13053746-Alexandrium_andersonii.AAC.1
MLARFPHEAFKAWKHHASPAQRPQCDSVRHPAPACPQEALAPAAVHALRPDPPRGPRSRCHLPMLPRSTRQAQQTASEPAERNPVGPAGALPHP